MDTPKSPHLALPFGFVKDGGKTVAAVVEQDSDEEIEMCVLAVLSFTTGDREEVPEFGIPDQSFQLGGIDVDALRGAIRRWEPRADLNLLEDHSKLSEFLDIVRINTGGRGA